MTKDEARKILVAMMDGIDPLTGEILPYDHLCNYPAVMRALHMAIMSMGNEKDAVRKKGRLNAGRPWTKEDSDELACLYRDGVSMDIICEKLQRRERGVNRQLEYLGLRPSEKAAVSENIPGMERAGKRWMQDEDELLLRMYNDKMPITEMAAALKRSEYAIYCRMENKGLFSAEDGYPEEGKFRVFNHENIAKLRDLFEEGKSAAELADVFGCSENSIKARLFYMGLIKESPIPSLFQRKPET